jgi:hypothetical protein
LAHAIGTITDGTTNYTPEPSPEDLFWPDATELIRSKIAYSSFNLIP